MRPKSNHRDLPPRMLRRTRTLKSGKVWQAFYYNGRDESGKRVEIPLGQDLHEAKRKWAELERQVIPSETDLMRFIFDKYVLEVIPGKAPRTQKENLLALKNLRLVFDDAPIDAIQPQHLAQYREKRTAKVSANREMSLFSHVWNMAREWGFTAKENPVTGVRKNPETGRTFYVDDEVWTAVMEKAAPELKSAMRLAYLSGQRPADVLKMKLADVRNDELIVQQNKTAKMLRIALTVNGVRTELGELIDGLKKKPVTSLWLLADDAGKPMTRNVLRNRFDEARLSAAESADPELAKRIKQFQFRDIRAKAASDIEDAKTASNLLGHANERITRDVYRRAGEKVAPVR